jgi:hypothetical protein
MKLLKAFVAGFAFPAFMSLLMSIYFIYSDVAVLQGLPLLVVGPFLWGFWNILFIKTKKYVTVPNRNLKIGYYGAFYGFLSALINSFYFEFTLITRIPDSFMFLYILVYPIVLFAVWIFVVNMFNVIFEVY